MSLAAISKTRFKTGERCEVSGGYQFDGYSDGSTTPTPKPEEQEIPLSKGETFPPIRSSGKACWWKLIRRL
jgi:hypothetical protein